MKTKLLLKVLPVMVLSIAAITGTEQVARSQESVPPGSELTPIPRPQQLQAQARKAPQKSIPQLIKRLTHPDRRVRDRAAFVLGQIGEPAIPSLIPLLKDKDPKVRASIVKALR